MNVYEIVDYYGINHGCVRADNERQALCKYLMEHEELNDMMLWQSMSYPNKWKLAEYDCEDKYLYARKTYDF